jgi:hypothetical protein
VLSGALRYHRAMRRSLLAAIILLALLSSGCEPKPPKAAAPPPTSGPAEPEELDAPVGADPVELIVQAVAGDASRARRAQRALREMDQCPYLADSPEGPIGLAANSYGLHDNDNGHVQETIRLLLQLGCDINQYSAAGLTPLHGAVIGRQPELLRLLLAEGADPKLRVILIPGSELGRSIAHLDAYGVAQVLLRKFPDDPNVRELLDLLKPSA